jgi:hypothetical protein
MFGIAKNAPVAEHEAAGETERVYHDVRQVMRVSGVPLTFNTWAAFGKSFPLLWTALRDNAGTYAFEQAADDLRAEAVRGALQLPRIDATAAVPLGASQLYQIGAALALYHYVNPKLLILTAAVRIALDEAEGIPGSPSLDVRKLPRGVPPRMYPMETVDEDVDEPQTKQMFENIRHTVSVSHVESTYRTLALWPHYAATAWHRLKPVMASPEFIALSASLQRSADALARALPYRVKLARLDIASVGEDDDEFTRVTRHLETLLPTHIVNVALLMLDGTSAEMCLDSPFPVVEERS